MDFYLKHVFFYIQLYVILCEATTLPKGIYHISLDSVGNYYLYWTVDYEKEQVKFEVHVSATRTDWFGIGFSDYGEQYPADYCLLWTDWLRHSRLQDISINESGIVSVDKQQDCNDFDIRFTDSMVKFTFTRKFDTCDDQDYIIEDGTTHIVWIKGKGPLIRPSYIQMSKIVESGMQRTQLLKNPSVDEIPATADTKSIDFKNNQVAVPNSDTTYWCSVSRLPDYLSIPHHIIEFEAVIQAGNEGLVHHMELFHCEAPATEVISNYNGDCFDKNRPEDTQVCKKVLAAWAMGATPFLYPEEAGLPIGGKNFNPFVMLEVHYNNPEMRSGWIDSSGIKLLVTPTLRKYDAGVLELGLEYTDKMAIPPGQTTFTLSGYCISECTAVSIPLKGITIFGSQLHTHLTGVQVITRHIRDGRELLELNRDNHYSTHFQEIRLLKRPVLLLPGDALITTCTYNTEKRSNITLGGFSIKEEMCINYVHYYPKIQLEVCKSSISDQFLNTFFEYMNEWRSLNTSDNYGISTNYENIDWTFPANVKKLSDTYQEMTLSMQCNASSGMRFPGVWENVPLTHILYPLPPPIRYCKAVRPS